MTKLVSIRQASITLRIARQTIRRMVEDGRIKAYRRGIGQSIYVDLDEIQPLLQIRPVKRGHQV